MRAALLTLFGLTVAVVSGVVAWLFAGPVAGVASALAAVGLAAWATRLNGWGRRGAVAGLSAVLLASVGLMAWQVSAVAEALGDTSGPVAPGDPGRLASATVKLEEASASAGFRLELDEEELTALVQEALAETDTPLGAITFDVDGEQGVVRFKGRFRSGDLTMAGAVRITAELGGVAVELVEAEIGAIAVPGALTDALEDIFAGIADFEGALAESGASVQSVEYTDTSLVLVGTSRTGTVLTSQALLGNLRERAASLTGAVTPPPEQLGPGRLDGTEAEGTSYYVALGDSLAANVGVDRGRDGYVSRFHAEIERRDGVSYGLRNFGIPGETSGSLYWGGQLEEAIEFMGSHDVAYVTIDIGANDLLGHLGSADCGEDLTSAACSDRIEDALASYEETLALILEEVTTAAGDATVVFLQTYNPFSLGLASFVEFERVSNEAVEELNGVAARAARAQGALVANGFTPMQGTTTATTHMTDSPPDIHPRAIGFDILAVALVEALG